MCGRFFLDVSFEEILSQYDLSVLEGVYDSREELFPTQPILTIVNRKGTLKAVPMKWGMTLPTLKKPIINARAETVHDKRLFTTAIEKRRCLIPASGYYEWMIGSEQKKQKMKIILPDTPLFAFAGLYNVYEIEGKKIAMASILTMDAAPCIAHIHDRMPVILTGDYRLGYLEPTIAFKLKHYESLNHTYPLLAQKA